MSREGDRIVATRMDILAADDFFEFGVDDIKREPTTLRPFVTFEADGGIVLRDEERLSGGGGRGFGAGSSTAR